MRRAAAALRYKHLTNHQGADITRYLERGSARGCHAGSTRTRQGLFWWHAK